MTLDAEACVSQVGQTPSEVAKGRSPIQHGVMRVVVAQDQGQTVVYVAQSGDGLLGALAFSDSLREDALEVVAQLQALGLSPMVLSGDSPAAVAAMASQAGIPAHSARGAVSPAEKAQVGSVVCSKPIFFKTLTLFVSFHSLLHVAVGS